MPVAHKGYDRAEDPYTFAEVLDAFLQARKEDDAQPMIADRLTTFNPRQGAADVCVVGCGPAGLALAAELSSNGVHVALVGK